MDNRVVNHRIHQKSWVAGAVLFVGFASIYAIFRSGQYNGDMVWQSLLAGGIPPHDQVIFPPDHLLYGVTVRGIWNLWSALGLPGRPHTALQIVNAILGGVMVATMFFLSLRISGRQLLAVLVAAVFGLMPYVWHHATDVETYGLSKTFQLLAIYLTFLLAYGGTNYRRYWLAFGIAAFHALAALYQYLHVMLVPAVLVSAFIARDGASIATRVYTALTYLVTVGVFVWVPYIYVATTIEGIESLADFVTWLMGPNYGWPAFARMGWVETPLKFVYGFASWPTPFALQAHEAKLVVLGHESANTYLTANWWRIPIVTALALVQVGLLSRLFVWPKRLWRRWREPVIVAIVIIIFYQAFALYWGSNFIGLGFVAYFVILQMIYITLTELKQTTLTDHTLRKTTPSVLAICALLAFVFSYIPEHDESRNIDLQETLEAAMQLAPGKDLIIGPGGDLTSEYWLYFAPDRRTFWLTHVKLPLGNSDLPNALVFAADRAILNTLNADGRVFVHRIFADEHDDMRPWNEFANLGIRREIVVEHFQRYSYKEAFVVNGHRYWEIFSSRDN